MAKLRHYWFILRWFLIGRYFCDLPKWANRFWWVVHKVLWSVILFSVGCTSHFILAGVLQ